MFVGWVECFWNICGLSHLSYFPPTDFLRICWPSCLKCSRYYDSFDTCLLRTYYMPGIVPGPGCAAVDSSDIVPVLWAPPGVPTVGCAGWTVARCPGVGLGAEAVSTGWAGECHVDPIDGELVIFKVFTCRWPVSAMDLPQLSVFSVGRSQPPTNTPSVCEDALRNWMKTQHHSKVRTYALGCICKERSLSLSTDKSVPLWTQYIEARPWLHLLGSFEKRLMYQRGPPPRPSPDQQNWPLSGPEHHLF